MHKLVFSAFLALAMMGCQDDAGHPFAVGGTAGPGDDTVLTAWTPGNFGTQKNPAFANNCRLYRETLYASPSNGLSDDRIMLSWPDGGAASLDVVVTGAGGVELHAIAVALTATTPKYKAFRDAVGTLEMGTDLMMGADIIDGTLCFETKLTAGEKTRGEFSFIIDVHSGGTVVPYSIGGDFELSPEQIDTAGGVFIDTDLEIDLQ